MVSTTPNKAKLKDIRDTVTSKPWMTVLLSCLLLFLLVFFLLLSINSLILVYYATQFKPVGSFKKLWTIFYQKTGFSPYMKMLPREFCPKGRRSTFMKCLLVQYIMKMSPEMLTLILPNWQKGQNATFTAYKLCIYTLPERLRRKKLDLLCMFF